MIWKYDSEIFGGRTTLSAELWALKVLLWFCYTFTFRTDKYDRRAYRIRTVNIEDLWIIFHDTMVYGTWVTKKTYEPELLLTLVYRRFNSLAQVWDTKSEILNPKQVNNKNYTSTN